MEREAALINQIKNEGVLPLFYHDDVTVCENVLRALYNGGVRCVEFTNRGSQALANFTHLVSLKSTMPGLILGIGTIKTPQEATSFIEAGADFLISPCFDVSVADVATASTYTGAAALAGAAEIARNAVAVITAIPRLA